MAAKRVLIVGAGPGGLTAGMILAHRGFDVTVFEADDASAGATRPSRPTGTPSTRARRSS